MVASLFFAIEPYAEVCGWGLNGMAIEFRLYALGSTPTACRCFEGDLGWKLAETFETSIRKTVQWYLDNPEWVAHVQSGAYRAWVSQNYTGRQA